MPPHTYKSEYPPGSQIDEGIKTFFEDFYRTSDTPTPDAHKKYAAAFTKDAKLVMISKVARGYDGMFPPGSLFPFLAGMA